MSAEQKRIVGSPSGYWLVFAISVILTAFCPVAVRAQNPAPNVQYTNKALDLGLRGNLTVNPSTQALEIQIPLGGYAGRASFNVPVAISYSSKVHRIKYEAYNPGQYNSNGQPIGNGYTLVSDRFAEYSSAGWTSTVGSPVFDYSASGELYDMFGRAVGTDGQCPGYACLTIDRVLFRMPDGSTHELRSSDQPRSPNDPLLDDYYSVDGARMHYQRSTQKLFMADGSSYDLGANPKYTDRNGNIITGTDTLDRAIPFPPMAGTGSNGGTPGDYNYSVPGVGGSINYTLKWRYLDDAGVLTTSQPLQYVADSRCPVGNGSYSPHLFLSDPIGTRTCIVNGDSLFRPVVLYQVVLPHDPANPNPPTYTFTYNIYGEIDKVVLPTGGYERYEYAQILPLTSGMVAPYLQANRGITRRYVSASGLPADEVSWQYSGGGGSVNITAPDGSLTALSMYTDASLQGTFGYSLDQPRAGRTYSENFYSPPDVNNVRHLLRRHLSQWSATGSNATGQFSGAQQAARNARLTKEVEIIFDTGGGALAKTTTHDYDLTYQFSTGVNETATNEYDYVVLDQTTAQTIDVASVPTGPTLLRRMEKTYLDATNAAYRDRNLLGLVSSLTVKDGQGNILAQSSINYDEGGQFAQLNDYGNVVNWTDPQTAYRGNPTTTSRWLNFDGSTLSTFPNGTYLTTHAQYDQCGSVRKTWDAGDTTLTNPSQVTYADAFSDGVARNTYAYPTRMTTAVPDLNGTYGSNAAFVATSVYDFNTGRAMSTTDANNQTTSYDYTDPFNRIRQITAPNGARVRYNYSDTPGDLYVQMLTDEDTRSIEVRKYFDNLGRPVRGFLYDGTPSTPWSVTDTYYDTMGRVSQVSNPYRVSSPGASVPATCSVCTASAYDPLGRVTAVTTPDGAQVTSAYAASTSGTLGTTVTVTDQAGKLRRSLTDALGRLVRVDEPDVNGALGDIGSPVQATSYDYDILGNLLHVYQDPQTRTFTYDSLSRLRSALNPESGTVSYTYDDNGNLSTKTDARSIVSTYAYDALNRVKTVTYTNDPASTPAVNRYYDGWRDGSYNSSITNSKGKIWQTETAGATGMRTTIDGYDLMGRPVQQEQQFNTAGGWSASYITSQTYDLGSHLTSMTYPSTHSVNYNYDIAGRLADKDPSHLAFSGNLCNGATRTYATGISYDSSSRLTLEQYGTDTAVYGKMAYNSRGQLAEIRASTAGNDDSWNRGKIINDYSLQCTGAGCNATDNNGNLRKQTVFVPNNEQNTSSTSWYQQYEYDSLNRLQQVHEHASDTNLLWQQGYVYDRWGNRTIDVYNTSSSLLPRAFDVAIATNRLLAPGDSSLDESQRKMRYDNAGNLVNDNWSSYGSATPGVATRTYDAENRMTSAQDSTGGTTSYMYDADGRRVRRNISGQPEVWQMYGLGGELLAEYAANANFVSPQKEYGYRNGQLLVTAEAATANAAPPTGLVANPPTSGVNVTLNWTEALGATNYRVERQAAGVSFSKIGHSSSTTFPDTLAVNGSAYLYQVCAADVNDNCTSAYSNVVLGARFNFPTDPTIVGYSEDAAHATTIQAAHINELRTAVNAVRHLAGMGDGAWTYSPLQPVINVEDVRDLRQQLDAALQQMGINRPDYVTDNTLVGIHENSSTATMIKAKHIRELRDRATKGLGGPGGSGGTNFSIHWLVADQLGTPRMIFDGSGSLATMSRHDYLPFGEELFAGMGGRTTGQGYPAPNTTGVDGARQKFTQKERDNETGLDYFLARYYSSTQGRFTSPDPIFGSSQQIANPQSWNLYGYVNNNPLAYLDPTGMERVRLGQHSDEEIDRLRKEKEQQIKLGKKDGTLTKAQEKQLKAERNTLGLEKEGNKLVNNLINRLPASERQGLQVSDFTLTTDPTGADFMSDPKFVAGAGSDPQGFADAAGTKAMFRLRGYSQELFINTTTTNVRDMMGGDRDWITYGATVLKHEQSHRDNDYNEFQAYTEQKRVLEQFGPGAFSRPEVYQGHLDFINRNIEKYRPKP